jgi:type IV fimbrial biogenesis protein FimT
MKDQRKRAFSSHRAQLGMTLVEIVSTLGIVAILSALAAPGIGHWQRSAARTATVNDFMHSIFLARSEAIKRNGVVSICRSVDGQTCADRSENWDTGWLVFVNLDADRPVTVDAGETIMLRHAGWRGGRITSNRDAFSFRPTSQLDVNGTITFCDVRGTNADARAIIISHTGRPRVSKRDASNRPLNCS